MDPSEDLLQDVDVMFIPIDPRFFVHVEPAAYRVPALAARVDNRCVWSRVWHWVRLVTDVMTYPSYGSCAGDLIATERDAERRTQERKKWQAHRDAAGESPR
jgi:hypothetical protein